MEIVFDNIEKSLNDLLVKYGIEPSAYTLREYANPDVNKIFREELMSVEIDTEVDFVRYADAVMRYCNLVVFPFFNKYSSIESLHELIKELPEKELTYHIGGEFQMKKVIIMKWC